MSQPRMPDDADRPPAESEPAVLPWPGSNVAAPGGDATDSAGGAGRDFAADAELRTLSESDFGSPRRRRVVLPAALFVATCFSTFFAGALNWNPAIYIDSNQVERGLAANWSQGLIYMAAVIGILLTHEMGHFLQTIRYGVPASWPYFIPVPILMTGTMGAVIGMEGSRADRKQLFDIGLSGPLAGLAVALPIIWFGIINTKTIAPTGDIVLGDPLIFKLICSLLKPDMAAGHILDKNNPLLMAGWVGMLITGLNMMPISQLDGGHVIYGLFGRKAHLVARTFLVAAIMFVVFGEHYNWTVMLVVVILLGVDHPPTRDDDVPLGKVRTAIGLASLAIPVLCFTPVLM